MGHELVTEPRNDTSCRATLAVASGEDRLAGNLAAPAGISVERQALAVSVAENPMPTLRELLDDLESLIRRVEGVAALSIWPDSDSGHAVGLLAFDLAEHCWGLLELGRAGRFAPAMSLMRPVQERTEYLFAAAHDERFAKAYLASRLYEGEEGARPARTLRPGEARGIIRRVIAEDDAGIAGEMLAASIKTYDLTSAALHPTVIPVSGAVRMRFEQRDSESRLGMLCLFGHDVSLAALVLMQVSYPHAADTEEYKHLSAEAFEWAVKHMGLDRDELLEGMNVQYVEPSRSRWWEE